MSGPVAAEGVPTSPWEAAAPEPAVVEVLPGREAAVGSFTVCRVLPRRPRRTVGGWCFVDHMGPLTVTDDADVGVAPHPHMGLHTVTWLLDGELVHRDSLGSEQPIRPGQLNVMTAGYGVSHSEENTGGYRGPWHGVQLWVAQPERKRNGPAAFEHHGALPQGRFDEAVATVLVGSLGDVHSPARLDGELVGADLALGVPGAVVPLEESCEHALVVLSGSVAVAGRVVEPGVLAYLGTGRDEIALEVREPARALLLGGVPFDEPVFMWWNFVARTREEISVARAQWEKGDDRFGTVRSARPRVDVGPPPWER